VSTRPPTILVVEDNPVTRNTLAATLTTRGYRVLEAEDGRSALGQVERKPDLVIQDLILPDMDGFDLLARLRAHPSGAAIPILCCSGFLSPLEQVRTLKVQFTDYLFKPVEPSAIIRTVETYLPWGNGTRSAPTNGWRLLLVDDNSVQLRLGKRLLAQAGFQVATAAGGLAALEMARRSRPDVIMSDVLMPRVDGFTLCREVRRDPAIASIPVVLVSSAYVGEADQALATKAGARALVIRSPGLSEAIEAVRSCLTEPETRSLHDWPEFPAEEYTARLAEELDRHISLNQSLLARLAVQGAEIGMLLGLTDTLKRTSDPAAILHQTVHRCADAAGASRGLAYLAEPDGRLRLTAASGFADEVRERLPDFFGHPEILRQVMRDGTPLELKRTSLSTNGGSALLDQCDAKSALIAPFSVGTECPGVMALLSQHERFDQGWAPFIEAACVQLSRVIALGRALDQAASAERHYHSVLEHAMLGVFQTTSDGRFCVVNPALSRIFGYSSPEDMALSVEGTARLCVRTEDHEEIMRRLAANGSVSRFECEMSRKDESLIWASLSARAVCDGRGTILHSEGMIEDITERRRTEEALRQSEKLSAMGLLLAGVAHELNNPLSVVVGYATLLQREAPGSLQDRLVALEGAAQRCARIVRNLLAVARQHPTAWERVTVNEIVEEVLELLTYPLRGDGIEIVLDLDRDLPPLQADPHQLYQVLVNLVTNAHQTMRGAAPPRRLTVATRYDASVARVMIEVADTGPGIPPHIRSRIFEPFFTTKPVGQGTGLGLSICYGIVHDHGGTITVRSEPGTGAVFTVELPAASSSEAAPPRGPADASGPLQPLSILVVDDEPEVAAILGDLLTIQGHRIAVAPNGAVALDRLSHQSYDLIVSDLCMPELDGLGLYKRLHRTKHPLRSRLVFVTGDTLDEEARIFLKKTRALCIGKPFVPEEITSVVRKAALRPIAS